MESGRWWNAVVRLFGKMSQIKMLGVRVCASQLQWFMHALFCNRILLKGHRALRQRHTLCGFILVPYDFYMIFTGPMNGRELHLEGFKIYKLHRSYDTFLIIHYKDIIHHKDTVGYNHLNSSPASTWKREHLMDLMTLHDLRMVGVQFSSNHRVYHCREVL